MNYQTLTSNQEEDSINKTYIKKSIPNYYDTAIIPPYTTASEPVSHLMNTQRIILHIVKKL